MSIRHLGRQTCLNNRLIISHVFVVLSAAQPCLPNGLCLATRFDRLAPVRRLPRDHRRCRGKHPPPRPLKLLERPARHLPPYRPVRCAALFT